MKRSLFRRSLPYAIPAAVFAAAIVWLAAAVGNAGAATEKEALLSQLRTIVVPFSKALLTAEKLTIRQRILLTIFLLSEKCFYRIYYERDNDEK